jgi:predicted GNAT family acetyltransferase
MIPVLTGPGASSDTPIGASRHRQHLAGKRAGERCQRAGAHVREHDAHSQGHGPARETRSDAAGCASDDGHAAGDTQGFHHGESPGVPSVAADPGCYDPAVADERTKPERRVSPADVSREDRSSGGRWRVIVNGHEGEMTFSRASPTLIIIDHTEVPDALRGQGVGQALVERAVEDARREGFRIIPLCPFAKAQFQRHAQWRDVVSA